MPYLTEAEPMRGVARRLLPGISCITAANPGPMTYHGTNTYIIEEPDGIVVLDPGPDDMAHVEAIMAATDGKVARILLSHAHLDHLGAVPALRTLTGAPVASFHLSADPGHSPDIALADGARIGQLRAVHTPGHAMDHLCFARDDGLLFSGDHVMAWCSTVVGPPPRGDMAAFFESLRRLIARDDRLYLPGHGPMLPDPQPHVQDLLDRRLSRERDIVEAVANGLSDPVEIAGSLYRKANPTLKRAAERNVRAHLFKLVGEGRVREAEADRYVVG